MNEDQFMDQIRFRVQRHESGFQVTVDGLYSKAGVTGQIGALRAHLFERLRGSFDAEIEEVLALLGRIIERSVLDPRHLTKLTLEALLESAIVLKSKVDIARLNGFFRGEQQVRRTGELAHAAFAELDHLLRLRMQEFTSGLHDASPRHQMAPASNRYVSLADNQRDEAADVLTGLKQAVVGANEALEEDRLIALSEIAAFEATIIQPRVSTDLIQRFVDTVLGWIKRTFTTAAVQELAQRLIQALLKPSV